MEVKLVSNKRIAEDFPYLKEEVYMGVSLADSYYIMIEDEELLEDGYLIGEDIDILIGKDGFKNICSGHNVIRDQQGDVYIINKWDGEQVVSKLKKELIKQGFEVS